MPKVNFSKEFEKFWDVYPRKTAKVKAWEAWKKLGVDEDAFLPNQIIGDIDKRTRLFFWPKDRTKIPHATTWINQMRWEDTGWEDEIETRKEDPVLKATFYKPVEDTGPDLSDWEKLLNRFWVRYCRTCGGMMPEQVTQSLRIKHGVLKEMEPVIAEELENDPSQRKEMTEMIVKTFLHRLDLGLQMKIRNRVLT